MHKERDKRGCWDCVLERGLPPRIVTVGILQVAKLSALSWTKAPLGPSNPDKWEPSIKYRVSSIHSVVCLVFSERPGGKCLSS